MATPREDPDEAILGSPGSNFSAEIDPVEQESLLNDPDPVEESRVLEQASPESAEERTNIGDISLPTDVNMSTQPNTSTEKDESGTSVEFLEERGPVGHIKSKKGYWVPQIDTSDFGKLYHRALEDLLKIHRRYADKRGGCKGKKRFETLEERDFRVGEVMEAAAAAYTQLTVSLFLDRDIRFKDPVPEKKTDEIPHNTVTSSGAPRGAKAMTLGGLQSASKRQRSETPQTAESSSAETTFTRFSRGGYRGKRQRAVGPPWPRPPPTWSKSATNTRPDNRSRPMSPPRETGRNFSRWPKGPLRRHPTPEPGEKPLDERTVASMAIDKNWTLDDKDAYMRLQRDAFLRRDYRINREKERKENETVTDKRTTAPVASPSNSVASKIVADRVLKEQIASFLNIAEKLKTSIDWTKTAGEDPLEDSSSSRDADVSTSDQSKGPCVSREASSPSPRRQPSEETSQSKFTIPKKPQP